MKIIVYCRNTVDWKNANLNSLDLLGQTGRSRREMAESLRQWPFQFGYCKYREQVKRLAAKNWNSVANYCFTCSAEQLMERIHDFQEMDYILPTDDDDWYNPEIYQFILKHLGEAFIYWDSWIHDTVASPPHVNKWSKFHPISKCSANSYAIRVGALQRIKDPNTFLKLLVHTTAKETAEELKWRPKYYSDLMSCYNRHPGSLSALKHVARNTLNPHQTRLFFEGIQTMGEVFPSWIQPYSHEMKEIIEQLNITISKPFI